MPVLDVLCDASVVLKWFHAGGEAEVDQARQLLDLHRAQRIRLSVLDLTAYEIGNVLVRSLAVPASQAAVVLDAVDLICRRLAPTAIEFSAALALAEQHRLTMYDATYAAVAASRQFELATLDGALLGAGLGRRPSQLIRPI
jgi:predicted nucleic acid-binding protein